MDIFAIKKSSWAHWIIVILLCASATLPLLPIAAYAQGLTDGATTAGPAPTPPQTPQGSSGFSCDAWWKMLNPFCMGRGIAVYSSSAIIYVTGWALGIAGVLMNASIELTTVGFDSQVYARIQGGVEAVWTVFRDIANIVIIGMFTFVALTMILGIEKFNARQMVAKVLLIAVLINFSLLFTRVIIASSNFVAIQFYKAAQFGGEPASSSLGAAVTFGQYSTGISGKFAQMMGVASFANTKDALWKVGDGTYDPGFMTIAMGLFTAIVIVAAALMFFYIAFLLIARTLLFIFLLVTSSLAFASYLIPNGGGFAGYGWDSWWKSLLKNAVFAPLLLMLLWATIQIGTEIRAISGSASLGGLLADPTKGGNINALFCYLLVLGMLYASVKIATKFSHEIGGFNYASLAPAYGAGLLGRLGGFFGRQVVGRTGLAMSNSLGARAKDASDKGNMFASRMYLGAAKQFEGVSKRDFNLMRGQLGKEIQGVAGIKKLDSIAGKNLEGFKGTQEKFVKDMAEQGKKLERKKDEQDKMRQEAIKAQLQADPHASSSRDHAEKTEEKGRYEAIHNEITKENTATRDRFENEMRTLGRQLQQAQSSGGAGSSAARNIEAQIAEARRQHESSLAEQTERIQAAKKAINRADTELKTIESTVEKAAIASGRLPEKFKSANEIARDLTKSSYTAALTRATIPGNMEELAEKAGKEAGKLKKKEERKETIDLIKEIAKEEGGGGHTPAVPEGGGATPAGGTPH